MQIRRLWPSAFFLCASVVAGLGAQAVADDTPEIPVMDGGIGPCRADFTVKDESAKPIYDAKIHVLLKYGIFHAKKMELEAGTNNDGKARFIGLPDSPKKPLEFQIKSGTVSKTVTDDPTVNCSAVFEVTLSVH